MDENSAAVTKTSGVVVRAKTLLKNPAATWPEIAAEGSNWRPTFTGYAMPLAAIGPICALIGSQIFGYGALGISFRPPLLTAIGSALASYILSLAGLFLMAFVANFFSPKFGGRDDWGSAFRLVAYAMTASWIGGVFGLIPALGILSLIASLYSIYLLYRGAPAMMSVPADKSAGYTAVTVIAGIIVSFVISFLAAALTAGPVISAADIADREAPFRYEDVN